MFYSIHSVFMFSSFIGKEKEFQKKCEAANKFRLRRQLLLKHMVFKRIRRVTRAEKKWLENVKDILKTYSLQRYIRHWKIYNGMEKLERARREKLAFGFLKALKENAEAHRAAELRAIAHQKKVELKRHYSAWNDEARRLLKIKENERKAKNNYETNLKKNAMGMFKQFIEIMRKINSDEFLKLAEKQDYFEIGITQVKLHRF